MKISTIIPFLVVIPAVLAIPNLPIDNLPIDQSTLETFTGYISKGNITVKGSINIKSTTDLHFRADLDFHSNNDGITFQVYTKFQAQKCDMRNLEVTIGANLIIPNPTDGLASDALCLAQDLLLANPDLKEMCNLIADPTITLPVFSHTESVTPHLDADGSFDWCDSLHNAVRSSGAAVGLQATDDWVDASGTDFDFCFQEVRPLFTGLTFNLTVSGYAFDMDKALLCEASYVCEADTNYLGPCVGGCPVKNIKSLEECQALCDVTRGCTAIVYNKYEDCYLKLAKGVPKADAAEHQTRGCVKVGGKFYNARACSVMRVGLVGAIHGNTGPLFDVNNINVGKFFYESVGEQPWVTPDGMFVIGGNISSPLCQLTDDPFKLTMDLTDHYNLALDLHDPNKREKYLESLRSGVITIVNNCLPDGYSIREDALSNLTLTFSNSSSQVVVSGLMGAGGGKNPAGLLSCVARAQNVVVSNVSTRIANLVYEEGKDECNGENAAFHACDSTPIADTTPPQPQTETIITNALSTGDDEAPTQPPSTPVTQPSSATLNTQSPETKTSENESLENESPENKSPENESPENKSPETESPENKSPENESPVIKAGDDGATAAVRVTDGSPSTTTFFLSSSTLKTVSSMLYWCYIVGIF